MEDLLVLVFVSGTLTSHLSVALLHGLLILMLLTCCLVAAGSLCCCIQKCQYPEKTFQCWLHELVNFVFLLSDYNIPVAALFLFYF